MDVSGRHLLLNLHSRLVGCFFTFVRFGSSFVLFFLESEVSDVNTSAQALALAVTTEADLEVLGFTSR